MTLTIALCFIVWTIIFVPRYYYPLKGFTVTRYHKLAIFLLFKLAIYVTLFYLYFHHHSITIGGLTTNLLGSVTDTKILYFTMYIFYILALALLALYPYFNMQPWSFQLFSIVAMSSAYAISSKAYPTLYFCVEIGTLATIIYLSLLKYQLSKATYSYQELTGALRYFVIAALSTSLYTIGFILYLLETNSLQLGNHTAILNIGLVTLFLSIIVKIGLFPFSDYPPKVYEGTDYPGLLLLAVLAKIILIYLVVGFSAYQPLALVTGLASLLIGTLRAFSATTIKSFLAYSGITAMGLILLTKATEINQESYALIYYYVIYSFNLTGVILVLKILGITKDYIISLMNSAYKWPVLCLGLFIFILSKAGLPPLIGFLGKFYIFSYLVQGKYTISLIIVVIFSLITLINYIRVFSLLLYSEIKTYNIIPPSGGLYFKAYSPNATLIAKLGIIALLYAFGYTYLSE
uniref:NADH:ubiquinone reductase (H(+)-translocating) n=1 Tax=Clathrina clathrus TaxID=1031547 RepID=L0HNR9_CLACL|nr:NADH dehydrogenase subunit 2 [Clathrina clathrus]AGB07374.1 NADH dehydrogenase subunit 2 [Clathrina clathrus]